MNEELIQLVEYLYRIVNVHITLRNLLNRQDIASLNILHYREIM